MAYEDALSRTPSGVGAGFITGTGCGGGRGGSPRAGALRVRQKSPEKGPEKKTFDLQLQQKSAGMRADDAVVPQVLANVTSLPELHTDVIRAMAEERVELADFTKLMRQGSAAEFAEFEFITCLIANLAASPEGYRALRSLKEVREECSKIY